MNINTDEMDNYDAVVLALTLALTAPTPEQEDQCVAFAEELCSALSETEIDAAKAAALDAAAGRK
jgi:hypothetical protein